MTNSMTAFARLDRQAEWGLLSWELRSVNHRFLEISLRLPEEFRVLEPEIREHVRQRLSRGKLEANMRFKALFTEGSELSVNTELAKSLAQSSREVDRLLYNPSPVNSMDVLRWPGVLEATEPNWSDLRSTALALLDDALTQMVQTRQREGAELQRAIDQRLDAVEVEIGRVRARLPEILQRQRQRLSERLAELRVSVDENRLEQEIALLTQRIDVDEEMDRLATHVAEVRRVLKRKEPTGRRLDFLMQELNREANTLASKSVDTETTRASVELKVLIEQMREQVQNVE